MSEKKADIMLAGMLILVGIMVCEFMHDIEQPVWIAVIGLFVVFTLICMIQE